MMVATPLLIFAILTLNRQIACEPSVKNPNIALLKPATQSSIGYNIGPHFSVDGTTTPVPSLTSTIQSSDMWQWWMVDLVEIFTIMSFRLSLFTECCGTGHNNVIEVTAQNPSSLAGFPKFNTNDKVCFSFSTPLVKGVTYPCDKPVTGRYIRIVRRNTNGKSIKIGEFEAFTYVEPNVIEIAEPSHNNLALNKPSSASSNNVPGGEVYAFNGILDGNFHRSRCFHTQHVAAEWEWLTVDLQAIFLIDSVRIMNRVDCCQDRAQNFTIEMSQEDPITLKGFPGNAQDAQVCHRQIEIMTYTRPVVYMCDHPILARYVRMVKSTTGLASTSMALNICEFEVFGSLKTNHYKMVSTSRYETTPTSPRDHRYALECTRQHGSNVKNMDTLPYIHVDLNNGQCHFLQSKEEKDTIPSANWALYQLD